MRHHIDRRAHSIAAADNGDNDELLTTDQVAAWLGLSTQWLEIGRSKHWGPKYKRITPRMVRYMRSDVRKWLESRTHGSTAEYNAARG
jgi:predicted DNA-binding transcriptional regulator AlpA